VTQAAAGLNDETRVANEEDGLAQGLSVNTQWPGASGGFLLHLEQWLGSKVLSDDQDRSNGPTLTHRIMMFALIADTETAFAQEQIGRPGAPGPTKPFPLFHNPTDQFVPSAPGITRYYDFRAQQQRPSPPPNTRPLIKSPSGC
jgi:hypothetical protein